MGPIDRRQLAGERRRRMAVEGNGCAASGGLTRTVVGPAVVVAPAHRQLQRVGEVEAILGVEAPR